MKFRFFLKNINYECLVNRGKSKGVFFICLYNIVLLKDVIVMFYGIKLILIVVERVDICLFY